MVDIKTLLSDPIPLTSSLTNGDNTAIISQNISLNYKQLYYLVKKTEKNLIEAGIKFGDYVAVLSPNSPKHVIIMLALLNCGAVYIPINYKFPAKIINSLLKRISCSNLILSSFLNEKYGKQQNSRVLSDDPELEVLSLEDFVSIPDSMSSNDFNSKKYDKKQYLSKVLIPERKATIIFSSGSTGHPKAVLHTYSSHIYSAIGANENVNFKPGDAWLLSLPLYHIGGFAIIIRAFICGGTVVITGQDVKIQEAVDLFRITHLSLVSTQLYRLLYKKKTANKFKKLKAIILGGSSFPKDLIDKAVESNLPIHTSYGSTEAASQVTTTAEKEKVEKLYTSGKVLKYRQVKIGPDGEISIKGKTLCKGYAEGESTTPIVDSHGWFKTGDIGTIDSHQYLSVFGRKDTMFQSGGENIFPEEIEKEISKFDFLDKTIVVPITNEEFGMRPVAFIKMKENRIFNEKALEDFLKDLLPKYKIPDSYLEMPDIIYEKNENIDRKLFTAIAEEKLLGVKEKE